MKATHQERMILRFEYEQETKNVFNPPEPLEWLEDRYIALRKHDFSASALSDKQLRKMAKKVCNGHQHAMRYNNMLNACFKMGKMILEELERQKADC